MNTMYGESATISYNETSNELRSCEFDYVHQILMSDIDVIEGINMPVDHLLQYHNHVESISTGTRYLIEL